MNEKDVEVKINFLSPVERENLRKCSEVKTDFTFEIDHQLSSPLSKITYFNLLTYEEEIFVFLDNSKAFLTFNGDTLACYSKENKCQSLADKEHIPVFIVSFHFRPQKGYKPSWKSLGSGSNKFSIRGSYYSITCPGI